MIRASVLCLLVGCGRLGFDAAAGAPCPDGYRAAGERCYRVDTSADAAWVDVEHACEAEDAHLVVLDDAAEVTAVRALLPANASELWIGVSDRVTVGAYRAVTGEAATFLPWSASEPSGGGSRCVRFAFDTNDQNDTDCGNADDFICEFDGVAADPTSY